MPEGVPIALGVDWGRARMGVAVSDELGLLAHPVALFEVESVAAAVDRLRELAAKHGAVRFVVGLPLNMDGSEGESAAAARRLAAALRDASGLEADLWDERLTTWEAERFLTEERGLPRARRKQVRDQIAACLILQGWLDARRNRTGP